MHISITIVSWNDRRYLPELFASIHSQTYTDYTVRMLDDGSADGESLEYIVKNEPHWLAVRNTKHQGFACGQNQLIRLACERYEGDVANHAILIAPADMDWHPDMLTELVRALNDHPEVDAVQPKVFRAYSERGDDIDAVKSDILDSTGMVMRSGWRCASRGAGEMDSGAYDGAVDIFAPSGAVFLVRASALHHVMIHGEVFDGAFFLGGEYADFGWRFKRAGHTSLFVPLARAHHYRGTIGAEQQSFWRKRDRKLRHPFPTALAVRNRLFTLLKNITILEFFRSLPWLLLFDGTRTLYGFLFEPETRRALLRSITLLPSMLRKRKKIQALAQVPMKELRRYVL